VESKIFLTSKTLWGVFIMALPVVLPMFGISMTLDDTALFNDTADKVFEAVGAILVVWGRLTAKKAISVGPGSS
jgi:hypothetical protein